MSDRLVVIPLFFEAASSAAVRSAIIPRGMVLVGADAVTGYSAVAAGAGASGERRRAQRHDHVGRRHHPDLERVGAALLSGVAGPSDDRTCLAAAARSLCGALRAPGAAGAG